MDRGRLVAPIHERPLSAVLLEGRAETSHLVEDEDLWDHVPEGSTVDDDWVMPNGSEESLMNGDDRDWMLLDVGDSGAVESRLLVERIAGYGVKRQGAPTSVHQTRKRRRDL